MASSAPHSEATPQQIVDWTEGKALIGTGSPFGPALSGIRSVSQAVARAVGQHAIREGLAEVDEPGLEKELAANFWEPLYETYEHSNYSST